MSNIVAPHGKELKPLLIKEDGLEESIKKADTLQKVKMNSKETSDLIMLAIGAFSPLDGFMTEADYKGVVKNMELANRNYKKEKILWKQY